MKSYRVTKSIDFCYGHRLLNYDGKCRYLHGHNGMVEIVLEGDTLDERGMVIDFTDIKRVMKKWIDENLDHRMILCKDDPVIDYLREQNEPMFLMDENPTAENIARIIFEETRRQSFPVVQVILWETPDSSASYSASENRI